MNNKKLLILLPIFGLFFSLILAEIFLRIIPNNIGYADNFLFRIPWFAADNNFDPLIGFWPKPNQEFRKASECYDVKAVHINSDGLRSAWTISAASQQPQRIAVFGDSMVQGLQVEDNQHFSAVLNKLLGENTAVVNFGVSSLGTIQELLAYRRIADSLKPQIVIVATFLGNDIFDNSAELSSCYQNREQHSERPYYQNNSNEISFPSEKIARKFLLREESTVSGIHNYFSRHFFVYNLVVKFFSPNSGDIFYDKDENFSCNCWPHNNEFLPAGAAIPPPDSCWQSGWRDTEKAILDFQREVQKNQGQFVLLVIPDDQSNLDKYKAAMEKAHFNYSDDFTRAYAAKRIENFALQNQIKLVSMYDEFQKAKTAQRDLEISFSCDAHWNETGHKIAAEAVFRLLKGNE